jgi:16S rRNA (uracil1498-N3)-methyltransferase
VNLILLEANEVDGRGVATLRDEPARHVIDVLQAAPGGTVRIGVLNGPMGSGTVTRIANRTVDLECAFDPVAPSRPAVDLLLALPRPKVLRRLWAQLSALGIGQIVLTNAARVERNYFDTHVLTEACYRPLLIEGLQQARDTWLPTVSVHKQFRVLIEDHLTGIFPGRCRLVAHPGEQNCDGLATIPSRDRVLLAIGPEGGWNQFELEMLTAHGFQTFDMGLRTLRTDTACIALLALVHRALQHKE